MVKHMLRRNALLCTMLLVAGTTLVQAKDKDKAGLVPLTAQQNELVNRAIAREKATVQALNQHEPLVEIYLQNMKPDPVMLTTPESDYYNVGRPSFSGQVGYKEYKEKADKGGIFHASAGFFGGLNKAFKFEYDSAGFTNMMVLDVSSFDREHYTFEYVGRAFLGEIRTDIFDVAPTEAKSHGRFLGRIWVDEEGGNIVRMNGVYTGSNFDDRQFFHFDSWRMNVQPGLWLPSLVYVEESRGKNEENAVHFKAQTHVWGYSLILPSHESDNASIQVEGAKDESQGQDISPLEAERMFVAQAETNVLDRLQRAGFIDPPSPEVDGLLETVTNNIIVTNNIPLQEAIHCRVLMTAPLESMSVGNTILLSRGLVDTLNGEPALAAVLAFQLAHILLGHRLDTRYAFNDRLLFPTDVVFQKIPMGHTPEENQQAAVKAIQLLEASPYKDKLGEAGLFFRQLQALAHQLPNLNDPRIGDSLLDKNNGTPWLAALEAKAPALAPNNLQQVAALPLGSRVRLNSWTDQVTLLHPRPTNYYTARDKMPFEVTPVAIRLTRYSGAPMPANSGTQTAAPGQ